MAVLGAGQIIPGVDLHIYELINSDIILVHLVSISLARLWSWLPEPPTRTLLLPTFPEKVPLNFFNMEQNLTVILQVGTSTIIPFPILTTSLKISSLTVNGSVFFQYHAFILSVNTKSLLWDRTPSVNSFFKGRVSTNVTLWESHAIYLQR